MTESVLINPVTPEDFYHHAIIDRDYDEIDAWWDVPFARSQPRHDGSVVWFVFRLDGGAWDRPTMRGAFDTKKEAVEFAESLGMPEREDEDERER